MIKKKRIVIGVTGSLGSGKSAVSEVFAKLGAKVLDADKLAKGIYRRNLKLRKKIMRLFGEDVFFKSGCLNKKALSQKAFANKSSACKLNKIVHPELISIIRMRIKSYRGLLILDAALLIESGVYRNVDLVILVKCPLRLVLKRVLKNNLLSEEEIQRRINCQLPFKNKERFADFIINNNGSRRELEAKVKRIYSEVEK